MTRGELADIIRAELNRHQPCGTRLLCDVLDDEHGIDLDDSALEAILRWLAGAGVRRSDNGKWSIVPPTPPPAPAARTASDAGSGEAADLRTRQSPTHLRTIERLRSGLPPVEAVEELSLDYGGSLATIRNMLDRVNGHGRWIMVRGEYGTGKTHFLQVFRSLALSRNYASCYLCADNGTSALNHPLRFLPNVLTTIEVPQRPGIGYADLLRELLLSTDGRQWLRTALERWRVRGRQPFVAAIQQLDILIAYAAADPGDPPHPLLVTQFIELVYGRSVASCSSTVETREVAYHLLLLAGDVVKRAGALGLALLVDEVESVFTKLPTVLSRAGALRVLSALCEAPRLGPVITAVAITPDAYTMLRHEMDSYDASRCHPELEPMSRLRRQIADGSHGCIDCDPPKGADLRRLLEKVRDFYLRGYPCDCLRALSSLQEWEQFASSLQRIGITPRLLIRRAIDFLDTQRYRLQS